jgi:ParB family transcriptional regulator, chromosome partitioning protein
LIEIEKGLSSRFGVKVQINNSKNGKGKIVLSYNNISELESLLEKFEG